jgi:hypothetical protein
MIDENNNPRSFINLEIIYGEIPNIIQYSDINNYIVFHSMVGTPDTKYQPINENIKDNQKKAMGLSYKGWGIYQNKQSSYKWDKEKSKFIKLITLLPTVKDRLKYLATTIGEENVSSEVVSYYGKISNIKKQVTVKQSKWIFKSQINIPTDKIKTALTKIATDWRSLPEFRLLQNPDLSEEQEFLLKKSLTAKIGSKILINLTSELLTGKVKTPEDHPKIEGIVTTYNDKLLKITGDFAQLNQDLWKPLKEGLDVIVTNFIQDLFKNELNISGIKKILKSTWFSKNINGDPRQFLLSKNKDYYKDGSRFDEKINIKRVNSNIKNTLDLINDELSKVENSTNIKKQDIVKTLMISSYKLQQLKYNINTNTSRVDLLSLIVKIIFDLT